MDASFLTDYMIPVIMGICLCAGYIVKHWVADADNRIIPTLCAALGVVLAVWMHWPASGGAADAGCRSRLCHPGRRITPSNDRPAAGRPFFCCVGRCR